MSEAASTTMSTPAPSDGASTSTLTSGGSPAEQPKVAAPVPDDPEWELPGAGKKKRSEWAKELERAKGLERAAHERNRESATIKRQAQELWDALGTNTREVLRHRGIDPIQFAQQLIAEQMEEATLSPEQRQARDTQRERDEYKKKLDEYTKQQEQQARAAEANKHAAQYETQFIEAIKSVGLFPDPVTVIRMAELTKFYLSEGVEVSAAEVAQEIKRRDMKAHQAQLRPDISDSQLDEFVPRELQERIRQRYLKQAQAVPHAPTKQARTPKSAPPPPKNRNGYIDMDEWSDFKKGLSR